MKATVEQPVPINSGKPAGNSDCGFVGNGVGLLQTEFNKAIGSSGLDWPF
jgi:hypothetical protein